MNLTKTALSRPIFIFMIMAAAFLLGWISYSSMRLELNPEVSFGTITIQTSYPGASPDDINELVSRKIEEAVSGVNGVREITSTSQEGLSSVVVTLELGTNTDSALNDVRSKVDGVTNSLPKDVLKPQVTKFDNSAQAVETLSFASPTLSSRDLRDLIDEKLADRFAQISGVASANVQGGDVREIQVQVKKEKLFEYGLGIADINKAVGNASLNAPSGRLITGDQEFSVRVKGDFTTPEEVAQTIITVSNPKDQNTHSRSVRLGDVATILDTVQERTAYSRLNGADTVVMSVQKTREGNAVDISKASDGVISQIEKEYKPAGIKITKTFDQSTQIKDSLADLQFALYFGILLVSLIVFIFLHDFRGTLIVALAIPTSIFATFIAMNLAGFTINNMSMLSLSLAIGVLVDDAIVVLENIYRHLKMGEDPRDAAINGRSEIGLAALAITFADVVVFLPIAFMGGITGQFFKPLALGFVFATLFSLFVSFTLTPLLAARWYKAGEDLEKSRGRFGIAFDRMFEVFEVRYRNALEWALNHRWFVFILGNLTLVAVFVFIAGTFTPASAPISGPNDPTTYGILGAAMRGRPLVFAGFFIALITFAINVIRQWRRPKRENVLRLGARIFGAALGFGLIFPFAAVVGFEYAQWKGGAVFKFSFLPDTDSGLVSANIELPTGSSLARTQQVVTQVENVFKGNPDVKYIVSNVGTQGVGNFASPNNGSNFAQVQATLYDKEALTDHLPWNHHEEKLRHVASTSVAADLTQKVGRIPGATVKIAAASAFSFGSDVQLSFTSDDRDLLYKTVQDVRDRLAKGAIKGVINPDISSKPGKPELRVIPDRTAAADQSLTNSDIGSAVRTLYQGDDNTKMRVSGLEYVVRVMLDLQDRNNPDTLSTIPIKFSQGNPVTLNSVAAIRQTPGISRITRYQRSEQVVVTADILPGYASGTVNAAIVSYIDQNHLVPNGVNFKPLGAADAQARESQFLGGALAFGIVLVYMLLASLYDNLLYPFIIQLAQPQAWVGALLALMITDKTLNLVGFIGLICLQGLVGKNAILVVDYTNTLRDRGRSRHDALVEAGPTRLRPIMMTTLALILGMLPVALAIGRGSEFRETIGITIIGGITLSTLLTLLVIPCSYTIFDDLSILISRARGIKPPHGGTETHAPLVGSESEAIPAKS